MSKFLPIFINGKECKSAEEVRAQLPRLRDCDRESFEDEYSVMPALVDDEAIARRDRRRWDELDADAAGLPIYGPI